MRSGEEGGAHAGRRLRNSVACQLVPKLSEQVLRLEASLGRLRETCMIDPRSTCSDSKYADYNT